MKVDHGRVIMKMLNLVQLGRKEVTMSIKHCEVAEFPRTDTAVLVVEVYKRCACDKLWQQLEARPTPWRLLLILEQVGIVDRDVAIGAFALKRLKRMDEWVLECLLRVRTEKTEQVLAESGKGACFVREMVVQGSERGKYQIVWLRDPKTLEEARGMAASTQGAYGVVASAKGLGIRVRAESHDAAYKSLLGVDPPEAVRATMGGVPWSWTDADLKQALQRAGWEDAFMTVRRAGRTWLVRASSDPPAGLELIKAENALITLWRRGEVIGGPIIRYAPRASTPKAGRKQAGAGMQRRAVSEGPITAPREGRSETLDIGAWEAGPPRQVKRTRLDGEGSEKGGETDLEMASVEPEGEGSASASANVSAVQDQRLDALEEKIVAMTARAEERQRKWDEVLSAKFLEQEGKIDRIMAMLEKVAAGTVKDEPSPAATGGGPAGVGHFEVVDEMLCRRRRRRVPVPGDGNCWWYAVFITVTGIEGQGAAMREAALDLKGRVVEHLRAHAADSELRMRIEEYARDGAWVDDFMGEATADYLCRDIRLLCSSGKVMVLKSRAGVMGSEVVIAHATRLHFDATLSLPASDFQWERWRLEVKKAQAQFEDEERYLHGCSVEAEGIWGGGLPRRGVHRGGGGSEGSDMEEASDEDEASEEEAAGPRRVGPTDMLMVVTPVIASVDRRWVHRLTLLQDLVHSLAAEANLETHDLQWMLRYARRHPTALELQMPIENFVSEYTDGRLALLWEPSRFTTAESVRERMCVIRTSPSFDPRAFHHMPLGLWRCIEAGLDTQTRGRLRRVNWLELVKAGPSLAGTRTRGWLCTDEEGRRLFRRPGPEAGELHVCGAWRWYAVEEALDVSYVPSGGSRSPSLSPTRPSEVSLSGGGGAPAVGSAPRGRGGRANTTRVDAALQKRRLQRVQVPGDGNCWWYAVEATAAGACSFSE